MLLKRGERGIEACVFKEFILRCKEAWSWIMDRTCYLSSCCLPPLRKYYSNLCFLNHCLVKTLFQGLRCVCIQDGGYQPCWPAAILDFLCRWTLGRSLTHSQSDDRRSLNLDTEGLVSNKMHRLCRRDLETAISLYNCICDERTEGIKHWQVTL